MPVSKKEFTYILVPYFTLKELFDSLSLTSQPPILDAANMSIILDDLDVIPPGLNANNISVAGMSLLIN